MQIHLLQDLAVVMVVAGGMALLCQWLRQPVVMGYLIAGLIIGPYTPPFSLIHNIESIRTMAELGLVFLMFSLGLEFNLPKIRKVGLSAALATLLEVAGMLGIGFLLGQWFGWSKIDSLFLGAILSISSTTIIVKVLMDFKMMKENFTQTVFGILILEDIVAVVILSILSGLGKQGGPDLTVVLASFFRVGFFIVLFLVLGLLFIPKFIRWVAHFGLKEILGIVTLGCCLAGSLLAHSFHLSIALGAFLTGAVLAASKEIHEIEGWIHPIRDMFSAIFFVSAGMLIDPELLWHYKWPILVVTLVTILGKSVSGALGSFLVGYDVKTSARVGMSLAQIGEFSFVIASLGVTLNITSHFLYPLAVAVSSLTTLATPYLIRNSDRFVGGILRVTPLSIQVVFRKYQTWVHPVNPASVNKNKTTIFSKYLVRLTVYMALLFAFLLLTQTISIVVMRLSFNNNLKVVGLILVWIFFLLLSLPLFRIISKYANHILLLLITRNKYILSHLNIRFFYNIADLFITSSLGYIGLIFAFRFIPSVKIVGAIGVLLFLIGYFLRKRIFFVVEKLEKSLDHITGLATSEPTRLAVIQSGERKLLLFDMMEQVILPKDFRFLHHKIRDLKLREQTGASIVAVYREGEHIPNPGPDEELLLDDVLVLIGNENDLVQARQFLLSTAE